MAYLWIIRCKMDEVCSVNPHKSSYILVKGTKGENGQRGGNAGSGGCAGRGGHAGHVRIRGLTKPLSEGADCVKIALKRGENGKSGKHGAPGKGGRYGRNGADVGRIEHGYYVTPQVYYGNLKLHFSKNDTVHPRGWYEKTREYVRIEENSEPPVKASVEGRRASDRENVAQVLRKTAILEDGVRREYEDATEAEVGATLLSESDISYDGSTIVEETAEEVVHDEVTNRVQDAPTDKVLGTKESPDITLRVPVASPKVEKESPWEKAPKVGDAGLRKVLKKTCEENLGLQALTNQLRLLNIWCKNRELEDDSRAAILYIFQRAREVIKSREKLGKEEGVDCAETCYDVLLTLTRHPEMVTALQDLRQLTVEQFKLSVTCEVKQEFMEVVAALDNRESDDRSLYQGAVYAYKSLLDVLIQRLLNINIVDPATATEASKDSNMPMLKADISTKSNENDATINGESKAKGPETNKETAGEKRKISQKTSTVMGRTRVKMFGATTLATKKGKSGVLRLIKTKAMICFEEVVKEREKVRADFRRILDGLARKNTQGESEEGQWNIVSTIKGIGSSKMQDFKSWWRGAPTQTEGLADAKKPSTPANDSDNLRGSTSEKHVTSREESFKQFLERVPNAAAASALSKFQYFKDAEATVIVKVISKRFTLEGMDIDENEFIWLMTRIMADLYEFECSSSDFIILFGTNSQRQWLPQYIILQLSEKIKLNTEDKMDLSKHFVDLQQREVLMCLSQKLVLEGDDDNVDLELSDVTDVLLISQSFILDVDTAMQLMDLSISSWPMRLRWLNCLVTVSQWDTATSLSSGEVHSMAYYLMELEQKYGEKQIALLKEAIGIQQGLAKDVLKQVLQNLYQNKWVLDDSTLAILRKESSADWISLISQSCHSMGERRIEDLVKLMSRDSNNDKSILNNMDTFKQMVKVVEEKRQDKNAISKWMMICDAKASIMDLSVGTTSGSREDLDHLCDTIAAIDSQICALYGFNLRSTQLLALSILLRGGDSGGVLEQVSTGEGKSLVIAAFAIVRALQGRNVDVVTSSAVLAERDAQEHAELYKKFGLKVSRILYIF